MTDCRLVRRAMGRTGSLNHWLDWGKQMNDPMLAIGQIEVILEEALTWERAGQLAAYSSVMLLLRELREHVDALDSVDTGYAIEKIVGAEWHVGAMFGLDVDNRLPLTQHHVGALGDLGVLKNILTHAE